MPSQNPDKFVHRLAGDSRELGSSGRSCGSLGSGRRHPKPGAARARGGFLTFWRAKGTKMSPSLLSPSPTPCPFKDLHLAHRTCEGEVECAKMCDRYVQGACLTCRTHVYPCIDSHKWALLKSYLACPFSPLQPSIASVVISARRGWDKRDGTPSPSG